MYRLIFFVKSNLRYQQLNCRYVRFQSSNVPNKAHEAESKEASEGSFQFQEIRTTARVQEKLPPRNPLVKSFFIGNVDTELFAFPQVISREDLNKLQEDIQVVREKFDSLEASKNTIVDIGKDMRDELQQLGLYGHNVHEKYGGSGYFVSETLIAAEPATKVVDVANVLCSHSVVADLLQKFGSDYQKDHILPKLANGSTVATVAFYEKSQTASNAFDTKAEYDTIEKHWVLSGQKTFVPNGKAASMYLVVAQTSKLDIAGDITSGITLFLVDASSPGVKFDESLITLGCKGTEYGRVKFENVLVPESFIVGSANGGMEIAQYMLQNCRLRMSLLNLGVVKSLINNMAEYNVKEKQGDVFLREMEVNQKKLSSLVCNAYALESMIYFTAGLIDEFDNQDVVLEIAITKLFSLDLLWRTASAPLDFMEPHYLLNGSAIETALRNAAQLYTHFESKDSLSLYAGLLGLHFAGQMTHENIRKDRNPLLHPGYIISKFMRQGNIDNPKLQWKLHEHLHPTLDVPAKWLEFSIVRLQKTIETSLIRYGTEIVERHSDIQRIAEMAAQCYAMYTSLARASRSYCIGLKFSNYELLLASSVCQQGHERVKALASEINLGPYLNNDRNYIRISKQIFKSKGYFPEHPTTYNF